MSLTLLIDLDDTLLGNSTDLFIPAYLDALGNYLKAYAKPEVLISTLLEATTVMMNNDHPNITLKESFDENFYPKLGVAYNDVQSAIDDFYNEKYPSLKTLTEQRPNAIELIQEAQQRGYSISIATNPLFPKTAIHQRLDWADLPVDSYSFSIISTYEEFHFAKPNPAYFFEILALAGWQDQPVIMVGNDLHADINPAREIGIATYLVTEENGYAHSMINKSLPSGNGKLNNLIDWLDEQPIDKLIPKFDSPVAIMANLKSTPAALATMTKSLTSEKWKKSNTEDEWSPVEILCHLRDVDSEINILRLKTILSESNPFIKAVDADKWAEERKYKIEDGPSVFNEFVESRLELLEILSTLENNTWEKAARHTIFGPTTLFELLKIIARHDRLHIQQIHKILENQ